MRGVGAWQKDAQVPRSSGRCHSPRRSRARCSGHRPCVPPGRDRDGGAKRRPSSLCASPSAHSWKGSIIWGTLCSSSCRSSLPSAAGSRALTPGRAGAPTGAAAGLARLNASAGGSLLGGWHSATVLAGLQSPGPALGNGSRFFPCPGKAQGAPRTAFASFVGIASSINQAPGPRTPISHLVRRRYPQVPTVHPWYTVKPSSGRIFISCQRNGKAVSFR